MRVYECMNEMNQCMNPLMNYDADMLASDTPKVHTLVLRTLDPILLHPRTHLSRTHMPSADRRTSAKKIAIKMKMEARAAYDDEDDERSCRMRQTQSKQ